VIHPLSSVLHAEQRPQYMGIEHGLVALFSLFGHRPLRAFNTRIVDRDIQLSESRDSAFDQRLHLRFVAAHRPG
jgi:hypothetical protein